jgi:hypothetical protein
VRLLSANVRALVFGLAGVLLLAGSASGVYISTEMFGKLGIADAMKDKALVKSGLDPIPAGATN